MDFIYKSSGVNRPLQSKEEKPQDNLNNTLYRDQINKVANSIKEIITALRQHEQMSEIVQKEISKPVSIARKSNRPKIVAGSIMAIVLLFFGVLFISKLL
jgi:hypothetical protein